MNENNRPVRDTDPPDPYAGPQRDANSAPDHAERVYTDALVAENPGQATERTSNNEREDNITPDDLSPETLYDLSGTRSARERGEEGVADEELRAVDEVEIGGGKGLDEAELARSAPLDGKPWADRVVPDGNEKKR